MRERILSVYKAAIFIGLIMIPVAHAQSANCIITVLSERNSGEKIRVNFKSTLHSKQECKTLAQMHYPNFSPEQTKSKSVTYQWQGKETPKQLAVAARHRGKSKKFR